MLNLMPNLTLPDHIISIFFGAVAVISLSLYIQENYKRQKMIRAAAQMNFQKADEKSYNLLHKAIRKAQSILGRAELESVKMVADSRYEARKLEVKYEQQFTQANDQLEQALTQKVSKAEGEFVEFLNDLRTRSEQMQLLSQEFTKQKTNEVFERFEQNLVGFLTQTEQKSVMAIELELRAAKQLIDTYKTQQLSLIDENIISMLEKTLSLVLAKKLSLKDQLDLVYEALEKAKAEKFIA